MEGILKLLILLPTNMSGMEQVMESAAMLLIGNSIKALANLVIRKEGKKHYSISQCKRRGWGQKEP
jgi:hypothetical protein